MLWYKRPTRPAGFSARVRTRKRAVAKKHSAGEALQSDDFEALWRDYKPAFSQIVEQQVLRSARGEATIRTCGLDRESLRQAREEEAEVVYGLLLELDTSSSNEAFEAALRSLQRKGSAKRKSGYPGMVRAIVVRELALTWAQFMRL